MHTGPTILKQISMECHAMSSSFISILLHLLSIFHFKNKINTTYLHFFDTEEHIPQHIASVIRIEQKS